MSLVLRDPVHSNNGLIFAGQEELSGNFYQITPDVVLSVAPLGAVMRYFDASMELFAPDVAVIATADGVLELGGEAFAEAVSAAVADAVAGVLVRAAAEAAATATPDASASRTVLAAAADAAAVAVGDAVASVLLGIAAEVVARGYTAPARYTVTIQLDPFASVWVAKGRSAKWRTRR